MSVKQLITDLKNYKPVNAQEQADQNFFLEQLHKNPDAFSRKSRAAHFTASAWLVNKSRNRVIMIYHNIYNSWSWVGGHADGETNLLHVALKETQEETGLKNIVPAINDIYSLESLTVDGHFKRGKYVSSHLHLNVTYLIEADESESLRTKPDENSGVRWFGLQEAIEASTEPWFQKNIYPKLNEKLAHL